MILKAYAKINIALDVIGKREDGYHLLRMIMQTIDLYDVIHINKELSNDDITITCDNPFIPTDSRNLCYKAAKLFKEKYSISGGVKIDIIKKIPMSAGMAGGSTDAAAVIKGMNDIFEINATEEELLALGLQIGADVPYCMKGGTALCEGIGEQIKPLKSFKNYILVVVKPPFGVSTKEVYGLLDIKRIYKHPKINNLIHEMNSGNIKFVAENMKNVLENVTIRKHPLIKGIKDSMVNLGCLGTLMSGSGPTVFAFFEDMVKAQNCYEKMKEKYRDVYITRTI
ncbi:4-(cytidine 5'-diphospho)-2-C-methyl-D-erythritol kinase [Clostridium folliculivorans]|uniref:4-diphosphocytidyl-2-C-methyl-D-erythritol kinase n=1 Tax=Clostridium folliculivorans TaxID=2886038 RepID=A0A9W5XYI5_9CLOT|nr:4-(cytidine 5'-diphospho)-2-C-methyl-D-erythritol kinase [Clostridium folliculivorans]GKU23290.1 4-diphosphocytidyl-2-C-methyl-D-erythritol kinase [Clostridium folliculivorans]GKU29407.1 4-diphosphocytidyl-2-C-methyl-D-erythritol kinase [Clostridium folliculivorans]